MNNVSCILAKIQKATTRFRTIQGLLAVIIVATSIIVTVIVSLTVYWWQYQESIEDTLSTTQSMVKQLEYHAASAVYAGADELGRDIVVGLVEYPTILAAEIDGNGKRFAFANKAGRSAITAISSDQRSVSVSLTAPFGPTEEIGKIVVALDDAQITAQARAAAAVVTAAMVFLQILTATATFIALRAFISKPITLLADRMVHAEPGGEMQLHIPAQLKNNEVGALITSFNDLLKRLEVMQQELIATEKMSAFGNMVAGISHELNTPIGNARICASSLQHRTHALNENLSAGNIARSDLSDYISLASRSAAIIVTSMERAADLVNRFKQLGETQVPEHRQTFNLNEAITAALAVVEPTLSKTTHRLYVETIPVTTIEGYPGPMSQVITNIVNNAIMHAFPNRERGKITISAVVVGDWINICISDDGIGILPEILPKIFDPYFSTKFGEGGSGLGLHIAKNIARNILGGDIAVASKEGHGTAFTIRFPTVAPKSRQA